MAITIDMPKEAEETLRRAYGDRLAAEAKEALAIEAYRSGKLSLGQFAAVLGIDSYAADGLLKGRGITPEMTVEEFDRELAVLRELRRE